MSPLSQYYQFSKYSFKNVPPFKMGRCHDANVFVRYSNFFTIECIVILLYKSFVSKTNENVVLQKVYV